MSEPNTNLAFITKINNKCKFLRQYFSVKLHFSDINKFEHFSITFPTLDDSLKKKGI